MAMNDAQATAASNAQFRNAADVTAFFKQHTELHFLDWFAATCANRGHWQGKAAGTSAEVKARFDGIWNSIPAIFGQQNVDLLQFCGLMGILINEVGAQLSPVCEACGSQGLAYVFNAIPKVKGSYNRSGLNKLAGDLFFADENFWSAHGTRGGASLVRSLPETRIRWNGSVFPSDHFPSDVHAPEAAFLCEADFYKFRGRGFLQMTWRANYKKLVAYVQGYGGAQPVILRYKTAWAGKDADVVCTQSSNDDWDALFEQTDLEMACRAIGLHNESSGNYLKLGNSAAVLMSPGDTLGSFYRMGLHINGGAAYATLFSQRMGQLFDALGPLG